MGCSVKINNVSLGEHMLYMGNNTYRDVLGVGDQKIVLKNHAFILPDVMYAPTISRNLVSMSTCREGLCYKIII